MQKNRTHPVLVATRVTRSERAIIDAAAAAADISVSELLRTIIVPAATARLTASVGLPDPT